MCSGEYVLVKLTGTYKKPIGPPILRKSEPAPGYAMYGVMLVGHQRRQGGRKLLPEADRPRQDRRRE